MKKLLFLFLFSPFVLKAQTITTVAGNDTLGYSGDGGAATAAALSDPISICTDANGNLYIADEDNERIRKVTPMGIISTFAGGGNVFGSGGPATAAKLVSPTSVCIDANGNVYIADADNNVVRKVDGSGIITTFAGTGTAGNTGNGGLATGADIMPRSICADANNNIYIADLTNNVVRKVSSSGIITLVAGTGVAGYNGDEVAATEAKLNGPSGVCADQNGNLYIADWINHRVRKVNTSGIISTFAGTGTAGYSGDGAQATLAKLNYPIGVYAVSDGNIYIADEYNNAIRKVNSSGIISTIAGIDTAGYSGDGGEATAAKINLPNGICTDVAGNLYIADYGNNVIRKIVGTDGIAEYQMIANTINVYPNPAKTNIAISATDKITGINITNILGQMVYSRAYNSERVEVDVSELAKGMYFIDINGSAIKKFLKE